MSRKRTDRQTRVITTNVHVPLVGPDKDTVLDLLIEGLDEAQRLEKVKKQEADRYKKLIDAELAKAQKHKAELRDGRPETIEAEQTYDWGQGTVVLVNKATGAELSRRDMTEDEKQIEMDLGDLPIPDGVPADLMDEDGDGEEKKDGGDES